MKLLVRFTFVLIVLFLSVLARAAQGETIQATLSGAQEVPSVSTVATGEFRGFINRGDGSIDYEFSYSGLQGTVRQAHIHVAQPSVNGGIVIWLCQTTLSPAPAGIPTVPTCTAGSGLFAGTILEANVIEVATQQIGTGQLEKVIDAIRAGNAYANVHTNPSTGGEIRGQIRASARK